MSLVDQYARQLKALLPRGAVWNLEGSSWVSKFLLGVSEELARINGRGNDLIEESDPRTALETLSDWESMLGLPDDCLTSIPSTATERRVAVTSKFASQGGQSPAYFIAMAAALGYTVTITEYSALVARAGHMRAGDRCYSDAWSFAWTVNLPVSNPANGVRFRAGQSRAGDRLQGYAQLDIQCVISRAAPAHTVVSFSFT